MQSASKIVLVSSQLLALKKSSGYCNQLQREYSELPQPRRDRFFFARVPPENACKLGSQVLTSDGDDLWCKHRHSDFTEVIRRSSAGFFGSHGQVVCVPQSAKTYNSMGKIEFQPNANQMLEFDADAWLIFCYACIIQNMSIARQVSGGLWKEVIVTEASVHVLRFVA